MEHPIVASRAEWLAARRALLAREKEETRLRDLTPLGRHETRPMQWVRYHDRYSA